MWNKGIAKRTSNETLRDGRLYLACGNPNGLRLICGESCEFARTSAPEGEAAHMVEVWLGALADD